jgi:hypothetical protein
VYASFTPTKPACVAVTQKLPLLTSAQKRADEPLLGSKCLIHTQNVQANAVAFINIPIPALHSTLPVCTACKNCSDAALRKSILGIIGKPLCWAGSGHTFRQSGLPFWARTDDGERSVPGNIPHQLSGSRHLPFVNAARWPAPAATAWTSQMTPQGPHATALG